MPFSNPQNAPSLDQLVKGAPPPNVSVNQVVNAAGQATHDANDRISSLKVPRTPSDPTSLLPSSPPQIYLNLLILEASLRSQFLTLRARRRQNTFVLTLLAIWILYFTYALWLRPREDGKGVGGSVYWMVDMAEKVAWMGGVVTVILFWATGQWERGVRWPRRWVGIANRGLRGMNCKIVIMKGPWYKELADRLAFLIPFAGGLWSGETGGSSYHYINHAQAKKEGLEDGRPRRGILEDGREYTEEDIAPGGDYIKLLLLPKPFTPDFRENWEVYRTEYWERENERRAELRKRVKARHREVAKEEGGLLWWTGWRGWKRARGLTSKAGDLEKSHHHHGHNHSLSATNSLKEKKRRPSILKERGRDGSHSRSSSRSSTPTPDFEERIRPLDERQRRGSSSTTGSTTSDRKRRKPTAAVSGITTTNPAAAARAPAKRTPTGSAPGTPVSGAGDGNPWQSKRTSMLSNAESFSSVEGEGDVKKERDERMPMNAPSA